ncbi:MAG TPA: heavy metal translocating P-type ATPase [Beutenbergiaceae bacterium]|nr:heavy metal translocating P-type ATPase [Beutenbergiaceae bacterium]
MSEHHQGHADHGGPAGRHSDHDDEHTHHGDHASEQFQHGHNEHGHHSHHEDGHGHHGHGGHDHSAHVAQYRRLFWIMLLLSVPVIALNEMFAHILGYTLPDATWISWVSPLLGTVIFIWGGRPFLTGAVDEIKTRAPGMMLLISLAITVAFVASWASTLGAVGPELNFWWELALLVVVMLLGHWIEMRSVAQTTSALDSLAALLPDEAERLEGEEVVRVSPQELVQGDVVLVRPGATVPADGRIVQGRASLDESMITGESVPVERSEGDHVVAGTVATDSGLRVQVTAVGEQTTLAGIQRLVSEAQSSSSRAQRLADRAAGWLFWYALGAAAITALVWGLLGVPEAAVVRTATVLVIACPHALGLAIPLVVSIATERAARGGVLVTDRLALEQMRAVDAVLFDKTGTLTKGEPALTEIAPASGYAREEVLRLAAAAEADSEHPLAKAIRGAAEGHRIPRAADFTSSPAVGVSALVEGRRVSVGGPYLLAEHGQDEMAATEPWRQEGAIILHVLVDGAVIGALKLADEIRPESYAAVRALRDQGTQVVMITGDARAVASAVAEQLGIEEVFAGVRPEDKAAAVSQLQAQGKKVAMVGDGVNDAPALAQADVGIAIGAGTDVAIGSAGVVLAGDDPRAVLSVFELSRAGYRKMQQNLGWAAGYNLLAVPLAAGVLAPIGFVLPMSVGALLMSASTVVVALNAQLLRRLDLDPDTVTPMRPQEERGRQDRETATA